MVNLTAHDYESFIADPYVGERVGGHEAASLVIVSGTGREISDPGSLPVIVCCIGDALGANGPASADLVVSNQEIDHVVRVVTASPVAATSLALLLRTTIHLPVEHGLTAESAVYSMLQGGAEFSAWRDETQPTLHDDPATVLVDRRVNTLTITLDRPHRHNAITRQLRDELCAALRLAVADDTINDIHLQGNGPSFCSGGDLAEFGTRPDSAEAHLTRLAQSPARLIHHLHDKFTVTVHGSTLGGGIEMAAFADHVLAQPDTRIGVPEVRLGLIPGAGGTVSLTRRIGRQRTAALALAVDTIDAETARSWGLVDEISATG